MPHAESNGGRKALELDARTIMRRSLGIFLLVTTIGLATCQSVWNSVTGMPAPAHESGEHWQR